MQNYLLFAIVAMLTAEADAQWLNFPTPGTLTAVTLESFSPQNHFYEGRVPQSAPRRHIG